MACEFVMTGVTSVGGSNICDGLDWFNDNGVLKPMVDGSNACVMNIERRGSGRHFSLIQNGHDILASCGGQEGNWVGIESGDIRECDGKWDYNGALSDTLRMTDCVSCFQMSNLPQPLGPFAGKWSIGSDGESYQKFGTTYQISRSYTTTADSVLWAVTNSSNPMGWFTTNPMLSSVSCNGFGSIRHCLQNLFSPFAGTFSPTVTFNDNCDSQPNSTPVTSPPPPPHDSEDDPDYHNRCYEAVTETDTATGVTTEKKVVYEHGESIDPKFHHCAEDNGAILTFQKQCIEGHTWDIIEDVYECQEDEICRFSEEKYHCVDMQQLLDEDAG